MQLNTKDDTLKRNYIHKYQFLIEEYEQVKEKRHPGYHLVKDFYQAHNTCPQTFLKYYNRFKLSGGDLKALLPGKRGPRYQTRRTPVEIETLVLREREKGCNKFEIHSILKASLEERTPSYSGIYKILKRHGKNQLSVPMKDEKRRIIQEKAGELAHIDCHHIARDTIFGDNKPYYLVCVVDGYSRLAWIEVIENIRSLTVMFAALRCFNHLNEKYSIQFAEVLTDNGPEFGPKGSLRKETHPFERLLMELGMKHRYIKPYRPQTNGKVERFWRTLKEDLIEGTYFDSIEHFKEEVFKYTLYYNELRPHQMLEGLTPASFCQRNT